MQIPFFLFPVVITIGFSLISCGPKEYQVTFYVHSNPILGPDDTVYITGNQDALGNWQPDKLPLKKEGNDWAASFSFPAGTQLQYKFTKGSWENEAVSAEGRTLSNYQHFVDEDTDLRHEIAEWKDNNYNRDPHISGNYEIHEEFPVEGLASRRLIVRFPPSYVTEPERRYPVLYAMDGQNVFDPYTSTLGHDWRIDEISDSMVLSGEIEEFISVAIYCDTNVRGREYSDDTEVGELYQEFMCCQLKPWIDSTYRTKPGPEHTAILGASMGGLISFIMAWEYPEIFGKAACMSPALKFQLHDYDVEYITEVKNSTEYRDIVLYLDNGELDIEKILQPGIDEMMELLTQKNQEFTWFLDRGAPHNEIAWSRRVWRPFKLFFGR